MQRLYVATRLCVPAILLDNSNYRFSVVKNYACETCVKTVSRNCATYRATKKALLLVSKLSYKDCRRWETP